MSLRSENKLRAARAEAAKCTNSACPQVIRASCAELGETLVDSQPSIVVRTTDAAGSDLSEVQLTIDGERVERLEGTAIDVDPGTHRARFERSGYATQEQLFVVQDGEKRRPITVTLQTSAPKPASEASAPPLVSPNSPPSGAPATQASSDAMAEPLGLDSWSTVAIATAGTGVLGLGAGAVLFVLAQSDYEESLELGCDENAVCKTTDGLDAADSARVKADWGTGFAYGGGALLVTGAAVYLIDTLGQAPASSAALRIAPQLGRSGGGVSVIGEF